MALALRLVSQEANVVATALRKRAVSPDERPLRGPAMKRYLAALSHAAGVDNTRESGLSLELVN